MKTLRYNLLAVAVIAGLGLSTVAMAGPGGDYGPMGDCPMMGEGYGHGTLQSGDSGRRHAMMQQYRAERMELLAARLKLTPEQEPTWKAFLAAQDAHHDAQFKARQEMRDKEETAPEHFHERVQFMEQQLTSIKALTKAADDLYAALNPTQKQVMDKFFKERRGGAGKGHGPGRGPAAAPGQADNDD
jgi:hypothetical protein